MAGAVLLLVCCVVTVVGVFYLCKYDRVNDWVTAKRQTAWTTFYYETRECTHIHLVPLDGRDHYTAEDGDCRCHTSKILSESSDEKFVYQHQKLGV